MLSDKKIDTVQKCSRKAREHRLSCLYLLSDNDYDLKLKEIENMKQEWKGKRRALDQDVSVVKDVAQMLDDESVFVKDNLAHVIDLIKILNRMINL